MKKRVLLVLLVVITLFMVTGCDSSSSSDGTSNIFKIKDVSFVFNEDSTFHNFKYKNSKELTKDESKYSLHLEYVNKDIYDGRFVYRISLSFSDETNLEKFLDGYNSEKVKVNGITWNKVEIKSTVDKKETKAIVYATEKNKVLYAVTTLSFKEANIDIDTLSEIFVNGVTIE